MELVLKSIGVHQMTRCLEVILEDDCATDLVKQWGKLKYPFWEHLEVYCLAGHLENMLNPCIKEYLDQANDI